MADWSSFDAQNPPGGATAEHMEKLSGITASATEINRAAAVTISLVLDNSASTGSDPDFYFEGPEGDTVSVDWGDGFAETFTLLGYDPSGGWDNAVEASHTYSDGQDTHSVVITGTDLRVLDVLAPYFTRPAGVVFPLDFRWLRGPGEGGYLELDISDTQGIAPLVSGLGDLQVLYLSSNQLTVLPDLSGLDSLKMLRCQQNQLTALPDLSLASLQELHCQQNQLTALPDLSALISLQSLYCQKNQLTALPDLSGLRNLQNLYCNNNHLTALPDLSSLTGLQVLECGDNQLTESAVNAVLAQCVAIETAVPGARTMYLNGGTNHAPTGQGITDAATLVAAGWTVRTN